MATNTLNYPKQVIQIEGKNKITDRYDVTTFDPTNKIESEILIDDTSGEVSCFLSYVLPVRKVIIDAPVYNSILELPYTITVKTSYSVSGVSTTISENIEGFNIKTYPESFGQNITNITIQTSSVNLKSIKCGIYGWEG
jgi:hypothetical protein